MQPWVTAALDLLFPALCPVCQQPLASGRRDPLCGPCWRSIDRVEPPYCSICGGPFLTFAESPIAERPVDLCEACATGPPPFEYARAAALYRGPLRETVHAFKFKGKRALARPLSQLLVEQCAGALATDVAAFIPVPLAPEREHERGFNQARLIAERIARAFRVPVKPRWLRRVRPTRPQTDLGAAERYANVRDAFGAASAVAGLHVVVIDDVFTTGATVAECARALQRAGARRIGVLTVARVVGAAV